MTADKDNMHSSPLFPHVQKLMQPDCLSSEEKAESECREKKHLLVLWFFLAALAVFSLASAVS
jgi:hypothetical protein